MPTAKVGLVAPFEGPYRGTAYEALFAAKLAIREYNASNRDIGPLIELIALNDNLRLEDSERQAQQMVTDPDILGVVAPWMADSTESVAEVYQAVGLSVLYPSLLGLELTMSAPRATWTRATMSALLAAIHEAYLKSDLSRQGVRDQLKLLELAQPDTTGFGLR